MPPPLTVLVVLMFTTAGLTRSVRSEKDKGVCAPAGAAADTASAAGISGAPESVNDDLRTPTSETMKKATRKAIRNIKNDFLFVFMILTP